MNRPQTGRTVAMISEPRSLYGMVEMFITPYCDIFGVKTVYFLRILYFGVILEMFEWF